MVPPMTVEHLDQVLSVAAGQGETPPPLIPSSSVGKANSQADQMCNRPMTPPTQLMGPPATPMAPARKTYERTWHYKEPEEAYYHEASPYPQPAIVNSFGALSFDRPPETAGITATAGATTTATNAGTSATATTPPSITIPMTPSLRLRTVLRRQGLVVYCCSFKQDRQKSQALVYMVERDSVCMGRLRHLIQAGREVGGSLTGCFNNGRTRIRYTYLPENDIGI